MCPTVKLKDGTTTQNAIPKKVANSNKHRASRHRVLARIDKVYFIDTDGNYTAKTANKQVLYDVTVLEGLMCNAKVFGVKDASGGTWGDGKNSCEKILTPTTRKSAGPNVESTKGSDGCYVYISWLNGNLNAPVIIGMASHPSHDGAKEEDGCRQTSTFNGIKTTIDKNGNHVIEIVPVYDADGNQTNTAAVGTKTTIGADGSVTTTDGTQTMSMSAGKMTFAGTATEMTSTGNMKIKASGVAEVKSTGIMDVDGSLIKVGGGGPSGARTGDMVMAEGTDSGGNSHTLIGVILGGSVLNLIGG